jgi:hypothetical protein
MERDYVDHITLAIATLGAVLGIFNAWQSWINDRVRLEVSVSWGFDRSDTAALLINVLNLSKFPVTVTHVGFDLRGTDRHMQILAPILMSREHLPVRLEPRTAFTVVQYLRASEEKPVHPPKNAYVKTACGLKAKCSGDFFVKFKDFAFTTP